jgi:hypothetical protein
MDSLTKVSGVAVSMLVAATASVMLLLPAHPRMRTSRGAGMTPAIMVASATARPPAGQPLVVGGAAHRCLPPAAPSQNCRVSGDSTGGTRAATAGRRRCRHGPLVAQPGGTGTQRGGAGTQPGGAGTQPGGTGRAHAGWTGRGQCCPGAAPAAPHRPAAPRWPAAPHQSAAAHRPGGQPAACMTGTPRRPR